MSSVLAADPARLRTAAARFDAASSHLSRGAAQVAGAAARPHEWIGEAADMYRLHVARLAGDVNTGSSTLGQAAQVLATLATYLEVAQQMAQEAQSLGSSAASLKSQAASMESSPASRMMLEEAVAIDRRATSLAYEAEQLAQAARTRATQQLDGISASAPSAQDRGWAGVLDLDRHDLAAYFNVDLTDLPAAVREMAVQQRVQLTAPEPEEQDQADEGCLDTLTCMLQTAQIMTAPIADALTSGSTIETRELLGQDYVDESTRAYGIVHATTNVASIIIPGPKLVRGAKYLDEMLRYGDNMLQVPQVTSGGKLSNIIKNLYKHVGKPGTSGNGTTMDAIRIDGDHIKKGLQSAKGLENWLQRNPDAPYHDLVVARSLLDELRSALRSQGW